jgi:hypothetical protein
MSAHTSPSYRPSRSGARAHRLSFAGHVAVEYMLGAGLAAAAVVLGFSQNTLLAAFVLAILLASSAAGTTISSGRIYLHKSWDRVLVFLLLAVTLASAIADTGIATLVFAAATMIEAILLAITHYVPER